MGNAVFGADGQPAKEDRPAFDCESDSYTPEMWVDDLERFGSNNDASSPFARFLRNPLHAAAIHGRVDVVKLMLDRGYTDKDVLDDKGRTPLSQAAKIGSTAVVHTLLAAGADVSLRCHRGISPLDRAARKGHVEIARVLLEQRADANAATGDGSTPLHLAAGHDKPEMVSLLFLKGADVHKVDDRGRTSLQVATARGHVATAQALLAAGADATLRRDENDLSALGAAAFGGHLHVVMAIVEHGVDVNAAAGGGGHTALHLAAMKNRTAAIEVLVGAGADIEARANSTRSTPLLVAVGLRRVSAAEVLLKHGASVAARNGVGETPLHSAAAHAGRVGTAELVDLLLRRGADEKAVSRYDQTPADMVGSEVEEQDSLAEDVERVRQLLTNAPADRAWRRRCFLVLCRAHYPGGRVQLEHGSSDAYDTSIAGRTRSHPRPSRAEAEWAIVASMLMGVGADPISLMGDGADLIFQTIVGYL